MLTNEKVLEIFQDYLNEDQATEVVMTRHGYAVMLWDHAGQDWSDVAESSLSKFGIHRRAWGPPTALPWTAVQAGPVPVHIGRNCQ